MKKTVITFGTFDLFHIGHLNLLERAAKLGDILIVGVSSDEFTLYKKGRPPIFKQEERERIASSLKCTTKTFIEDSFEKKREYIGKFNADILVMGADWRGHFDHLNDICQIIYIPRTRGISTTSLIETIQGLAEEA